jgi:hypothetical protein
MRSLLKYDLLCYGSMTCVAAGTVLNIVFLQALQSDGPSRLVLIPVATGLAAPLLIVAQRLLGRARDKRYLEALGAGAILYLVGSSFLSFSLPSFLQSEVGL